MIAEPLMSPNPSPFIMPTSGGGCCIGLLLVLRVAFPPLSSSAFFNLHGAGGTEVPEWKVEATSIRCAKLAFAGNSFRNPSDNPGISFYSRCAWAINTIRCT